jgi:hypothetical protein
VPVVEAAFEENPNAARFYLRRRGSSQFRRTAPAVVVPDDSFGPMRERFIGELDLLVAIGGQPREREKSGTEVEIDMALDRSIPVIILKQAGGRAAQRKPEIMRNLPATYSDSKVADLVRKVNEELDAVAPEALPNYVESVLVDQIEDLIAVSVGSAGRRAADDETIAALRRW